ncbi:MAG TPA: hypothetical protein VGZ93_11675 [Candidatus Methylacidiphilales bacterium]|jgi:hypothetical protein|nr:hypothetical protein [Candidatus Methylacidiphilales bacterium]
MEHAGISNISSAQLLHPPCAFNIPLPNSDNRPTSFLQKPGLKSVTGFIACDFLDPEFTIGLRDFRPCWMSVPKLTIHKYGNLLLPKDKIGFYGHSLGRFSDPDNNASSPPRDALFAKYPDKSQFRQFIAPRPDARHDIRAFCFGKNVGHFKYRSS